VVHLDQDRRSLYTRQPIGGVGTVRITVNDELLIPQGGLFSPAQLYGALSGPFELVEDEDILTVTTSAGTDSISFQIRGIVRLSSSDVLQRIRAGISTSKANMETENGHLLFTDTTAIGPDAFVQIGGTAAAALGFGNGYQQVTHGKMVYPGWGVYDRPIESKIDAQSVFRYPKFALPVRTNPVFKVSYTVPPNRCLRCRGGYVENDLRLDPTGQTIMVQNEDLLYQAALKIILTDRGSNPYQPWYGTQLRSRIGSKILAGAAAMISEDVRQALARFQSLQEAQSKYQKVTYKERLYTVLSVNVKPHVQNLTAFTVEIVVQNASGEPVNLTTVFTVPGVVALMGSNGLALGTQWAGVVK